MIISDLSFQALRVPIGFQSTYIEAENRASPLKTVKRVLSKRSNVNR